MSLLEGLDETSLILRHGTRSTRTRPGARRSSLGIPGQVRAGWRLMRAGSADHRRDNDNPTRRSSRKI